MLVQAMKKLGPCLSTQLADHLTNEHSLRPDAARQRVSRAPAEIKRLNLQFPRRARFLYLEEDFDSGRFWRALTAAIRQLGGSYAMALNAIEARTIVPLAHFPIVCGAPIKQRKHLAADAILNRLKEAKALDILDVQGLGPCVVSREYAKRPEARDRAEAQGRLLTERVLLDTARDWLRRLALASWDKIACRDDRQLNGALPRVGTFAWDMTGPSYLAALSSWTKDKKRSPGFLVCDVLLNDQVNAQALAPFLHKCETLQQLRKVAKAIHIFIAHGYSKEALDAARRAGVIPATPRSLFGKDAADAFKQLAQVLTQTALGAVDPEKFQELFDKLSKVEGAVGNMRGTFFELLVAEIIRRREPEGNRLVLNKLCRNDCGETAEVDVYLELQQRHLIIECKGRHPGTILPDEEVREWLHQRIPRVREHLQRDHFGPPIRPEFELWITGRLSKEAIEMIIKTREANARVYDLRVIWSKEIRERVRDLSDKGFLDIMEKFFLPPLSEGDEDHLLMKPFPIAGMDEPTSELATIRKRP
jgi:hypothetical protein